MIDDTGKTLSRRHFQKLALGLPIPLALLALGGRDAGIVIAQDATGVAGSADTLLVPTPDCTDADDLTATLEETEGPYFTPNSPERVSLLDAGMPGTQLVVTGYVYSTDCQPIEGALLDFWHADDAGQYDNVGYTLRGHQFTDENGLYELTTIVPGIYVGRTRHIHVKVQAPNQPVITSQLFFPDEPDNASDGIFDERLVMDYSDTEDGKLGCFTFVSPIA